MGAFGGGLDCASPLVVLAVVGVVMKGLRGVGGKTSRFAKEKDFYQNIAYYLVGSVFL